MLGALAEVVRRIVTGALVAWRGRPWPDWGIGLLIVAVVQAGAVRILRLN